MARLQKNAFFSTKQFVISNKDRKVIDLNVDNLLDVWDKGLEI